MRAPKNGTGHVQQMRLHVGSVRGIHAFVSSRQLGKSNGNTIFTCLRV